MRREVLSQSQLSFSLACSLALSLALLIVPALVAEKSNLSGTAFAGQTDPDFVPPEITLPMPSAYNSGAANSGAANSSNYGSAAASSSGSFGSNATRAGYPASSGNIPGMANQGSAAAGFAQGAAAIPGMSNPNQPNPFLMKAVDRLRLPPGTSIPGRGSGAPGGAGSIPGYPQAGGGQQMSQTGAPPMGSSAFMQPGQQPPAPGTPLQRQLSAQGQIQGQAQTGPVVTIQTNKGNIVMQLFPQHAPITCKAFVQMVKSGFYNGLTFHRVEPGFVVQGGCPNGNGTGNYIPPGQSMPRFLPLETSPYARHNAAGVVAMARQPNSKDSASCQFYITLGPKQQLDNQYTVFGGVVQGLDVVQRIAIGDRILNMTAAE